MWAYANHVTVGVCKACDCGYLQILQLWAYAKPVIVFTDKFAAVGIRKPCDCAYPQVLQLSAYANHVIVFTYKSCSCGHAQNF